MRNTLREPDIPTTQGNILSLIDFSFPQDQADIVMELVKPFIVPNSILSADLTETAIKEARQSVEPIVRSFVSGETLVRLGQIIGEIEWEALQRYGLIQSNNYWQDIFGAGILTLLITILISLYHKNTLVEKTFSVKAVLLVAVVFLLFLGIARFFVMHRTIVPYIYPIAAFGLTFSIIFNFEGALLLSLILGIMTAYGMPNGFDLTISCNSNNYGRINSGKSQGIGAFFQVLQSELQALRLFWDIVFRHLLQIWLELRRFPRRTHQWYRGCQPYFVASIYLLSDPGITTSLQLLDTSRPDHPLLQ